MGAVSAEEKLLEFLYACPVGLIECDGRGEIGMINPHAMQHLVPIAGARDIGNLFSVFEQHAPELRNMADSFAKPTGRICDNHRIVVDLGEGRRGSDPKVLACTLVRLGQDRMMATLSDISVQVSQEQRLRQVDVWFSSLLDRINNYSVLTIDPDGKILKADDCFAVQLSLETGNVIGQSLAKLLGHDPLDGSLLLNDQLELAARDGWHLQESWQRRRNGERYWCQRLVVSRSEREDCAPISFLVVLRDVPRRESAADDLRRLLTRDHLTGAANRMHFSQTLDRECVRWRETQDPLSLAMIDLDYFKTINDTYGHPVGDRLLRQVADVCAQLLPHRGLFARLGGEEFAALLPGVPLAEANDIAEKLREAIAAIEVSVPENRLNVTASLACATIDEAGGSAGALIELADKRLYAAKNAGRNCVYRPDAATE